MSIYVYVRMFSHLYMQGAMMEMNENVSVSIRQVADLFMTPPFGILKAQHT